MPHIVSASRRTDIPRYYARWFVERRRQGFVEHRSSFGVSGTTSLRDEDVVGYLFWTRYARPFRDALRSLRVDGVPYAFQYTITGYGAPLEPHVPPWQRAVDDFRAVRDDLPDARCIQWRYDPIVLSASLTPAWHADRFAAIARALEGATAVVNTSIVEPYLKAVRRTPDPTVRYRPVDPSRHKTVARRSPPVPQVGDDAPALLRELAEVARAHGVELRACCNPEWGLPPSQCCGDELFAPYGDTVARASSSLSARPTRSDCRCLASRDIGMDNSCVAGCTYCYVVASHETALASLRRHDPAAPTLR